MSNCAVAEAINVKLVLFIRSADCDTILIGSSTCRGICGSLAFKTLHNFHISIYCLEQFTYVLCFFKSFIAIKSEKNTLILLIRSSEAVV